MDQILHISLLGGTARALVACTTDMVEAARRTHDLAPTACAALGRTLTASAMLGSMLKGADNSLTVTIRGGGPIGALVCVARSDGTVKGYCDEPRLDLPPRADGKLDVGGAVGREGRVTVVKDLGLRDPYVGQTRLVSGEIAEDLAFYLTVSEQTPSLLSLGVMVEGGRAVGAGGVLVQPFPGCPEEDLKKLEALAPRLSRVSGLARAAGDAESLAAAALSGLPYEVLEARFTRFACDCSRERIERALLSMGEKELLSMIEEQHGAQVSCHFCNRVYDFTEGELRALLAEGRAGKEAQEP